MTPIIDSHLHFIDTQRFDYPWLRRRRDVAGPNGPADYARAIGDAPVEAIVLVEAAARDEDAFGEAQWMAGSATGVRVGAIVAQARLELGDAVADELDRLKDIPLVHGIRRVVRAPFQSDPDFCVRPAFLRGVRLLARYGFSFDIACACGDLPNVIRMVDACPDVQFVLNHLANPPDDDDAFAAWRADMKTLAERPNVCCKISGLPTHLGEGWTAETARRFVAEGVAAFGATRVLFGSDYPVQNAAGGFRKWRDAMTELFRECSADEQAAFFNGNARRVYGIVEY